MAMEILNIGEQLELFAKVCKASSDAHKAGNIPAWFVRFVV